MHNQSFTKVFVIPNTKLLAQGTTVDLAPGQLGIFDYPSYAATTAPTYAKNKALIFEQGVAQVNLPDMFQFPQKNNSKIVKGKLIDNFIGFKAKRGSEEAIAVGFDGGDPNKKLSLKDNQVTTFYLHLSGEPITRMFSDQGITREYFIDFRNLCKDNCTEAAEVDPEKIADELIRQVNADKQINSFVQATKIAAYTTPPTAAQTFNRYTLTIPDNGDFASYAEVQSQYPGKKVTQTSREGIFSTYTFNQISTDSAPAAFSNANFKVIADCPTCPAGYTLVNGMFIHEVVREDNGTDVKTTLATDYATAAGNITRIHSEYGQGHYIVLKATEIANAVGTDKLEKLGKSRNSCVITTPTTTAWGQQGTFVTYSKKYQVTVPDACEASRLAAVQAAYPGLTVAVAAGTETDNCVRVFETTVHSNLVTVGCEVSDIKFAAPQPFEGLNWTEVKDETVNAGNFGVKIKSAFVRKDLSECTYDSFSRELDTVHIEGSTANYDYNSVICNEPIWPVTRLSRAKYDQGDGYWVRKLELKDKGYDHQYRSVDPGVRESEGFTTYSELSKFYDEYQLFFAFEYKVGGFSQKYTDNYVIKFYVPEGTGKPLEDAINSYLTSANIAIDPVVL